jgi:hypothetical protein
MISTLNMEKAVQRARVALSCETSVIPQQPAHPGLSQVAIGTMPEPNPLRLHPYLWDMRINALIWRSLRRTTSPHLRETAKDALLTAMTYRAFHTNFVLGRAGA